MEVLAPLAWGFGLVLFRSLGFVIGSPLFGMTVGPAQVRVALGASLSLVAFLGAGAPRATLPAHFGGLLVAVLLETLMGLFAGLAVRFALEAAAMAGQLAGLTMGLGFGALLDPLNGAESTTLGQLFRMLALSAALALGLERELVSWLARSVVVVPPGTIESVTELARGAVTQALAAIALGIRLGFPFVAATTLGQLALGLLGRAAQQLHFSNVGFSVSILFGGGALWLAAPSALALCAQASLQFLPG
ncbi:MAG: flagellar biosynthetic protein FliR [Myxococcaceae bacterium]|nr:flagellar biosynthetic protein FliR [Myxococcaceae bacterium]